MIDEMTKRPFEDNGRRIKYLGDNPALEKSEAETDGTVKNLGRITRKNYNRKKVLNNCRDGESRAYIATQDSFQEEKRKSDERRRISVRVLKRAIDEQEKTAKSRQARHKELMRKFAREMPYDAEKTDNEYWLDF